MERVDENGERRQARPDEVAAFDQMGARFDSITRAIMDLRERSNEAAGRDDTAELAKLTAELGRLCKDLWPDAPSDCISYIMHLTNLLEDAQNWTTHVFQAADMIVRAAGTMVHPEHPLHAVPGFGVDELAEQFKRAETLLRRANNSYTTGTGVVLENVHLPEACGGDFCVIHNPVPGPWDGWATHWSDNWDGMMRRCPHGIDHVAMEEMLRQPMLGMVGHTHPTHCACACDFTRTEGVYDNEGQLQGFVRKG